MNLYRTLNPYTGLVGPGFNELSGNELKEKLQLAEGARLLWSDKDLAYRSSLLLKLADLLLERKQELGDLITLEMGKPIAQAIAEIEKSATCCQYFAKNGPEMLKDISIEAGFSKSIIRLQPLGTVLGIYPWNYPFWQVIRFAAPALLSGNLLLMKHAPNVPQCAMEIEKLFLDAGFPLGVLQSVFLSNEQVADLIAHDTVKAVTLTGSETAGSQVAAIAGKHLKKTVLELGGSDPFIVFEDADQERAIEHLLLARFGNTGQSCVATKRLIIADSIAPSFLEKLVLRLKTWQVGDPADANTKLGPLARADLKEKLRQQLDQTLAMGAEIYWQGTTPDGACFFPPTIVVQTDLDSPAAMEELFGPVLPVFTFRKEQEAVFLANRTAYGLGSSVWTNDPELAERMANKIESGSCYINEQVRSTPELPFGGIKRSGYGRELSAFGLRELVNVRTLVWH